MENINLKLVIKEAGFKNITEYAKAIGKSRQTVSTWCSKGIPGTAKEDLIELLEIANRSESASGKYTELIDNIRKYGKRYV